MLQKVGPKPLIEPAKLKTEADWIEAGRQVFEELDHITQRIYDPDLIAILRSPENSRSTPERLDHPVSLGANRERHRAREVELRLLSYSLPDRRANDSMALRILNTVRRDALRIGSLVWLGETAGYGPVRCEIGSDRQCSNSHDGTARRAVLPRIWRAVDQG